MKQNHKSKIKNQNLINILDKLLRYLYYALFALTPLVMASNTSELFEFNKMVLIYSVSILVFFLWSTKIILAKKAIFKRTPLDIPIGLFLTSQILSTLFSIDLQTSIFGYYGRFNGGLISIIAYLILFYGFISNFDTREEIKKMIITTIKISLAVSFFVILWGLPGRFGHDLSCLLFMGRFDNNCWTDQFRPAERMFSTLGQPNWLGAYLAINFFLGLYFFLRDENEILSSHRHNLIYFLYLIFNFVGIIFTRSRSALLAVFAGMIIFVPAVVISKKWFVWNFSFQKKLLPLLVALLIPIVVFKTGIAGLDRYLEIDIFPVFETHPKQAKPSSKIEVKTGVANVTESFDIRKIVWQGAYDLGRKYPLFGTGVETFAYSYYFVRPKEHNLTSEWDFLYNKAHNEYLNYFATTGSIGLMTYLVFIGGFIYYCCIEIKNQKSKIKIKIKNSKSNNNTTLQQFSNNNLLLICLLIAWLTILITNFFGFSTSTINLFFYLIPAWFMALCMVRSAMISKTSDYFSLSNLTRNQKISLTLVSVLTIYFLIRTIGYYLADINYAQADNYSKMGDYQTAANLLYSALKLKNEHVYEDKLSYILANLSFIASYQKQPEMVDKLMSISDSYNQKSLRRAQKNVLYWKTRAKNLYLFYQIKLDKKYLEEGIYALEKAENLAPTDPKIPYSKAIFYSLLLDETKEDEKKKEIQALSLKAVEETISLKPDYRDGYFLKGQLLKKYGRNDEAKAVFKYILKNINPNDEEAKKEIEQE